MPDTALTTRQSCANVSKILEGLAPLIVANTFLDAAAAWSDVVYDDLLAATPEQLENESGGYYKEPGSMRLDLDSGIELDSRLQGVTAGVGYRTQGWLARIVDMGHLNAPPHPFLRQSADRSATPAIIAFAEVLEQKIPGLKP